MTRRNPSSVGPVVSFFGQQQCSAVGKVEQSLGFSASIHFFPNHYSKTFDADSDAEIEVDGSKPVVLGPAASFFGQQQCSW